MTAQISFLFFDNSVAWGAQSSQHRFESVVVKVQGVSPPTKAISNLTRRDLEDTAKQQMIKGLMYGHKKISRKGWWEGEKGREKSLE